MKPLDQLHEFQKRLETIIVSNVMPPLIAPGGDLALALLSLTQDMLRSFHKLIAEHCVAEHAEVAYRAERYEITTNSHGTANVYHRGTEKNPEWSGEWVASFPDPTTALNFVNWQEELDKKFDEASTAVMQRYGEAFKRMSKE